MPWLHVIVEGELDRTVVRRVLDTLGLDGSVLSKGGRHKIRDEIGRYRQAAANTPTSRWLVLVDLDDDECAPRLVLEWAGNSVTPRFCLRVAVRQLEAWLLADRTGIARALGVPQSRIPRAPEDLSRPKRTIVDLARRSRSSKIRNALVPRPNSRREVGAGYTAWANDFVATRWNFAEAARNAPSLSGLVACLRQLMGS